MEHELTKYTDSLYYAALCLTGNAAEAEDITQETFLAAWQSISRGYKPDNLWAWLNRVLRNKHCDRLRVKYRLPTVSYDCGIADGTLDEPYDETEVDETDEQLEAIRREIGYLARIHREVFVRFYMHGDSIDKIASELGIPVGTVKSRLDKGRRIIRKEVTAMESYTKQSYEPEILRISCSGGSGLNGEPFSLVRYDDALTQNILIVAYPKPLTEVEIAKALGTPVAFVEPIIRHLIDGELMARREDGKVYSNFIQFTLEDRMANFKEQLEYADAHYPDVSSCLADALGAMHENDYYARYDVRQRAKLDLYFALSLLCTMTYHIAETVTEPMPYSAYPYRKNGGRWIAMGNHYPPGYDHKSDAEYWKYNINGEYSKYIENIYGKKSIGLQCYGTDLGDIPGNNISNELLKLLYELHTGNVSGTLEAAVLDSARMYIDCGILKKDGMLSVDIPVLTKAEFIAVKRLAHEKSRLIFDKLCESLAAMIRRTCVKLPPHLTGVPKWQQYLLSRECIDMALVFRAIGDGLIASDAEAKTPAAVFVIED